jgi:hypothetical protein
VRAIEQLYADALPGHLAELARARRPGEPIGDDGSSTALRRQVAQQVRHGAASGYHSGAGASMIGRTSMGIVRLCGAFTIRSDLAAAPGHCGAGCAPVGRGEGLHVSAECLTASRWQPRRAAGVPLPSSVHQMEPAGPDLVHSVSSQDPSPRQNPYAAPRGTRAGAGTEGCSTGLLPRPRSCQSWSDSFRFQTSKFRSRTHRRSYSKSA